MRQNSDLLKVAHLLFRMISLLSCTLGMDFLQIFFAPAPTTKEADVLVKLPQGVPIYLTYITQEADAGGKLASRGDPYGWDGRPDRQLAAATYTSPTRGAP